MATDPRRCPPVDGLHRVALSSVTFVDGFPHTGMCSQCHTVVKADLDHNRWETFLYVIEEDPW